MIVSSKLPAYPFGCHEIAHTWSSSCSKAWLDLGIAGVLEAGKIYFPLFVITRLVQSKKLSKQTLQKICRETVQSSLFLGSNCFFFLANFCIIRTMLPALRFRDGLILASFLSSLMAIFIERKSRRDALAVYMVNVGSEALSNFLRERGLLPHIPHGGRLLATVALTASLFLYKMGKNDGLLGTLTQSLLGSAEIYQGDDCAGSITAGAKICIYISQLLGGGVRAGRPSSPVVISSPCRHRLSCSSYACRGAAEAALLGVAVQSALTGGGALLRLLMSGRRAQPPSPAQFCQLAASLGTVTGLFRLVSCLLRRTRGRDDPWHAIPAGVIASVGLRFYNSPSLTLYLFWKSVEAWCRLGAETGVLPRPPGVVPVLYAVSTGVVLSLAVMEAHHIKPSYWRFLNTLTNSYVSQMNWPLIGLEAGTDTMRLEALRRFRPTFNAADVRVASIPLLRQLGQLK